MSILASLSRRLLIAVDFLNIRKMSARPPTAHNVPADDGCLQLIIGPMFSGKT